MLMEVPDTSVGKEVGELLRPCQGVVVVVNVRKAVEDIRSLQCIGSVELKVLSRDVQRYFGWQSVGCTL